MDVRGAMFTAFDELLIEFVEYGCGELFGDGKTLSLDDLVLGVHGNINGIMIRMSIGPSLKLAQTIGERIAVAAEIEVLYMEDLKAGLIHLAAGVVRRSTKIHVIPTLHFC